MNFRCDPWDELVNYNIIEQLYLVSRTVFLEAPMGHREREEKPFGLASDENTDDNAVLCGVGGYNLDLLDALWSFSTGTQATKNF
jgi:hypothetical protein